MRFEGKTAIVTGAGSGIGKATCIAFAREGARVAVACRGQKAGEQVVAEIQAMGGSALYCQTDVGDNGQVRRLFRTTQEAFGSVDILFNNAGIGIAGPTETFAEADYDRIMDTNVKGHFLCCREAIPYMKQRNGGAIINMASVLGRACLSENAVYTASKAAIEGLTKALALELGPLGIRVNCVVPGSIDTPMLWEGVPPEEMEQAQKEVAASQPLGYYGVPDEVAVAVLFLAESKASFISGSSLVIDGGLLTKISALR